MLAASREEASTDALTGLGNRRSLTRELERVAAEATPERPALPRDLRSRRLQGLQRHLRPPRRRLAAHPPERRAPRLGRGPRRGLPDGRRRVLRAGPAPSTATSTSLLRGRRRGAQRARRRLHHHLLYGRSCCPWRPPAPSRRSTSPTSACTCRRTAAACRPGASPATCCCARWRSVIPRSGDHVHGVAELAVAIGERLGLLPEELEDLRQAAELHDMGKVAIPDAILDKPGPLDDDEWEFMRRHTIIGERILQAAPALERVADDRALDPRAHGRQGLSRRAGRRGDPARRADRARLRRLRGDDRRPQLPQGDERRGGDRGARALRGRAVRPARRHGLPRARGPARRARAAAEPQPTSTGERSSQPRWRNAVEDLGRLRAGGAEAAVDHEAGHRADAEVHGGLLVLAHLGREAVGSQQSRAPRRRQADLDREPHERAWSEISSPSVW